MAFSSHCQSPSAQKTINGGADHPVQKCRNLKLGVLQNGWLIITGFISSFSVGKTLGKTGLPPSQTQPFRVQTILLGYVKVQLKTSSFVVQSGHGYWIYYTIPVLLPNDPKGSILRNHQTSTAEIGRSKAITNRRQEDRWMDNYGYGSVHFSSNSNTEDWQSTTSGSPSNPKNCVKLAMLSSPLFLDPSLLNEKKLKRNSHFEITKQNQTNFCLSCRQIYIFYDP